MKKMLLLLVSGLFIACMAGSAMAMPASSILKNADNGQIISNQDLSLSPGQSIHILFCVDAYTPLESDQTYTYGYAVTPWKNSNGVTLGSSSDMSVDVPAPKSFTLPAITTGTGSFTDTKIITVTLKDTAPIEAAYKVTIGDEGFILTSASTTISNNIPEFPTVALPVAGMIGLLFIFGRKKEGL
jgi:hypothetical protein